MDVSHLIDEDDLLSDEAPPPPPPPPQPIEADVQLAGKLLSYRVTMVV